MVQSFFLTYQRTSENLNIFESPEKCYINILYYVIIFIMYANTNKSAIGQYQLWAATFYSKFTCSFERELKSSYLSCNDLLEMQLQSLKCIRPFEGKNLSEQITGHFKIILTEFLQKVTATIISKPIL